MLNRPLFAALALTAAAACSAPTANPDAAPDLSVVILTGDGQVGAPATDLPSPWWRWCRTDGAAPSATSSSTSAS